jgi:hypothetical protein
MLGQQDRELALSQAWANILGVSEAELVLALAPVAQLVPDLEAAVQGIGDDPYVRMVDRYRSTWANPIFPIGNALNTAIKSVGLPGPDVLDVLAAVASHLHKEASEGPVPSDNKIEELKTSITGLLEEVRNSDLPDEVTQLILKRLHDILNALDHMSTTGPAGIRFAIEALVGAADMTRLTMAPGGPAEAPAFDSPIWKKLFLVLLATWTVFAAGPEIQASLHAWSGMEQALLGTGKQPDSAADAARCPA